jgi:hypothetical protein
LQQIQEFGPKTVAVLRAELGDVDRFARTDQIIAYGGMDIEIKESGRWKGKAKLSKRGSGLLRRMLYLAALRSTHTDGSAFGAYYHRLVARGLNKGSALMAVMRKMLAVAAHLLKYPEAYEPTKVCGQRSALWAPTRRSAAHPWASAKEPSPARGCARGEWCASSCLRHQRHFLPRLDKSYSFYGLCIMTWRFRPRLRSSRHYRQLPIPRISFSGQTFPCGQKRAFPRVWSSSPVILACRQMNSARSPLERLKHSFPVFARGPESRAEVTDSL